MQAFNRYTWYFCEKSSTMANTFPGKRGKAQARKLCYRIPAILCEISPLESQERKRALKIAWLSTVCGRLLVQSRTSAVQCYTSYLAVVIGVQSFNSLDPGLSGDAVIRRRAVQVVAKWRLPKLPHKGMLPSSPSDNENIDLRTEKSQETQAPTSFPKAGTPIETTAWRCLGK